MKSKLIIAALLACTIGGASALPSLAANNQQQQMMMMLQQQQAQQQQAAVNQAAASAAQAAAAQDAWAASMGFPYKDSLGRAYGPSGYAPCTGLGNNVAVPYTNGVIPVSYANSGYYNNGYNCAPNRWNNGFGNLNTGKLQRKLAHKARKINRKLNNTINSAIRYW